MVWSRLQIESAQVRTRNAQSPAKTPLEGSSGKKMRKKNQQNQSKRKHESMKSNQIRTDGFTLVKRSINSSFSPSSSRLRWRRSSFNLSIDFSASSFAVKVR